MQTPITPSLERELIDAGAFDPSGYILREALCEAYNRIAADSIPMRVSSWQALCNAERFILSIHRYGKRNGLSFDAAAEALGY